MRRKIIIAFVSLSLMVALLCWAGVGSYSSSSAVQDLKAELEMIHGREYTGKETETGTEDMVFVVEPKSWFLTNWNFRNAFGIDYRYECKVILTTYADGDLKSVRTITYQAVDPMGAENLSTRARLELNSKTEQYENK